MDGVLWGIVDGQFFGMEGEAAPCQPKAGGSLSPLYEKTAKRQETHRGFSKRSDSKAERLKSGATQKRSDSKRSDSKAERERRGKDATNDEMSHRHAHNFSQCILEEPFQVQRRFHRNDANGSYHLAVSQTTG